ncbi:hypothetical protein RND71_043580 [Anisodus tanguticus]|uniref:Uncharacterized protein n=1 Tax=Anisodus tanguticus TaxID=243964 RepID=A0AAE1QNF5_9SOLA|nr:hypothetical protein RND71_043580 [Anisodus tanguticus]
MKSLHTCIKVFSFYSSKSNIFLKPNQNYFNVNLLNQTQKSNFHTTKLVLAQDLYKILNVSKNASQKEIKKAYYQLAKKYHPDTNKNDPEAAKKFQQVSEAYEILSDDSKRKNYDTFGKQEDFQPGFNPGSSGFQGFHSTIDPEELFKKVFGDLGFDMFKDRNDFGFQESDFGHSSSQETTIRLSFLEAANGCTKTVNLNTIDTCQKCRGTKCAEGHFPIKCPFCNGTGMETITTGPYIMRSTCRMCHGSRMYIKYPCSECMGKVRAVINEYKRRCHTIYDCFDNDKIDKNDSNINEIDDTNSLKDSKSLIQNNNLKLLSNEDSIKLISTKDDKKIYENKEVKKLIIDEEAIRKDESFKVNKAENDTKTVQSEGVSSKNKLDIKSKQDICDIEETCTGSTPYCPNDDYYVNGESCKSNGITVVNCICGHFVIFEKLETCLALIDFHLITLFTDDSLEKKFFFFLIDDKKAFKFR